MENPTFYIWNIKNRAWYMAGMIGFSQEIEFAGAFEENWVYRNTGLGNTRSGDYANNILISTRTLHIVDLETKVYKLSPADKKAFKSAINVVRKAIGLPLFYTKKDDKIICPYCRKEILLLDVDKTTRVGKCSNINCKREIIDSEEIINA